MKTARPSLESRDSAELFAAVQADVVGRRRQIASSVAVLDAGRDLLLEGPPGTGKSTLLRSIARHRGIPLLLVEGNGDLSPAKLVGHHDPAEVMRHGYRPDDFVAGPLVEAMRSGGLLFLEEFNRIPEDTLNVLLGAMAEREINVPRYGLVAAGPTFRVIAAMNPYDNVGTTRVSVSVFDRLCRMAIDYQSEEDERAIVARRTGERDEDAELVAFAVRLVRATRMHAALRSGSSVRGAIDLVLVARQMAGLEGTDDLLAPEVLDVAASLALSSKVVVDEALADATPESVIAELVDRHR